MERTQTLVNNFGEVWTVEHHESERLTHIGGFLLIFEDLSSITLSTQLTAEDRAHGREVLLGQLATLPIGTRGTHLWHPADT
jgi:hypothetical protein